MPEPRPRRTPVADLFEQTFRVYRDNFLLLAGISAVFQLPLVVASVPFAAWQAEWMARGTVTTPRISPEQASTVVIAALLFVTFAVVASTFLQGAISYVVGRARNGDRPPAREVWLALRRLARPLLGYIGWLIVGTLGTIIVIIVALVVAVGLVAAVRGDANAVGALSVVLLIGCVVAVLVLTARLAVSIPALVLERLPALKAFRRSWDVTRGATLRTLGILVLVGLVVGVVTGIASPLFLPGMVEGVLQGSVLAYALAALVSGAAQVLVGPIPVILITLLYFDYAHPA